MPQKQMWCGAVRPIETETQTNSSWKNLIINDKMPYVRVCLWSRTMDDRNSSHRIEWKKKVKKKDDEKSISKNDVWNKGPNEKISF